jgi:hypothetical protein
MAAAQEAKDEAAMRKAYEDIRPLMEQNRALRTKFQSQILGILTAEQKLTWQGYRIWQDVTADLKGLVGLTDEQAAKVRTLANTAAKDLSAIKEDMSEESAKARNAVRDTLITAIKDTILTPEQRKILEEKMMPMPPTVPPAAEKPAAEKPAAEKAAPAAEKKPAEAPKTEK